MTRAALVDRCLIILRSGAVRGNVLGEWIPTSTSGAIDASGAGAAPRRLYQYASAGVAVVVNMRLDTPIALRAEVPM